jgi:hypothetical protein
MHHQRASDKRPWVPAWFAEAVIMAHHLATNGLLEAFAQQVPLGVGAWEARNPLIFSPC